MSDVSSATPAAAETPERKRRRLFSWLAPGERKLVLWIAGIALLGVGVATYLVYIHYADIKPICAAGNGGCEKVQASEFSKLAGIPVADLGLLGYLTILGSLFVRGDLGKLIGAATALTGFGFSMYLTYRELFTIDAICQWCVGSAVLMTLLAILTTVRLIKADPG